MNVRDDLALVGWFAGLAPDAAQLPGAGPLATRALQALYRDPADLDVGLSNCLRRCVATVAVQAVDRREAPVVQRRVMARKDAFAALLTREEPLIVAIAAGIDAVEGLSGRGFQLAPVVLDTFRVQARELYPREEYGGARAAIEVLEALLVGSDAATKHVLQRELASLHGRAGEYEKAAELRGVEDGFTALDSADHAAGRDDMEAASVHLSRAQKMFERSGSLAGMAAVRRRRAALVDPEERVPVLKEAIRMSKDAGDDLRGIVEGLEELSRAWSESGKVGPAVAALGEIARIQRSVGDAAGEARALQLAGRLLCESSGAEQEPGPGLVMLLWAADIGGTVDPVLADLTHRYVQGFQYTLSDREWASIEPLFDKNRAAIVDATFARYLSRHAEDLP
jgi:hypothetical protein